VVGPLLQVREEAARLQESLAEARLPSELLADLRERAGYLGAAVDIAEQCAGFVDIA
jgi:hypothetical protein